MNWNEYVIAKLEKIENDLVDIKVEITRLKTISSIWGAGAGLVIGVVLKLLI